MTDTTPLPENRTVPTRLDAIRDLFGVLDDEGTVCECAQCVAGRELLAVVEALFVHADGGVRTPQQVINGLHGWRDEVIEGCAEWRYYDDLANAVKKLA